GCRVGLAGSQLWLAMRLLPDGAPFIEAPVEDANAWLWREQLRGYAGAEAVASPGYFEWQARPRVAAVLVLSTEETHPQADPESPFAEEHHRTALLIERAGAAADEVLARLSIAADQFLIL